MDHHHKLRSTPILSEGRKRMIDRAPPGKRLPLFGFLTPGAGAATGGDKDRGKRHRPLDLLLPKL
jgi:hypothetical protein